MTSASGNSSSRWRCVVTHARENHCRFTQCATETIQGEVIDAASSNATLAVGMSDATVLLTAVEEGDPEAAGKLLELLYTELRHLAASKMAHEAPGQTLQPTA